MTDPELVAKKLARIETCVRELRTLARPEHLAADVKEQRFIEHTLQLAVQAALDVASHIVSDERLGEPRTNRELFSLLERNGWIDAPLADSLRRIAGFRNVLVHGYDEVDLDVVREVLTEHLSASRARRRHGRGATPNRNRRAPPTRRPSATARAPS